MVRYFYTWTPVAIVVGTVLLLTAPWLAVIALMVVSLVAAAALAALAWAIVSAPLMLSRAIGRRRHGRRDASPQAATALSVARRDARF